MARIYTKTGDDGITGLLYGGRLSKSDDLVEACGDIDEAVAAPKPRIEVLRRSLNDSRWAQQVPSSGRSAIPSHRRSPWAGERFRSGRQ